MQAQPQILERVTVKSTDGARDYLMIRTAGGWQHADAGCRWWQTRASAYEAIPCRHIKDAIQMSEHNEAELERSVIVAPGVEVLPPGELYRLIDEFDAALISQGVNNDVVEAWCYSFRSGREMTTGISIRGVEAAIREQMKHGDIVRLSEPKVQYEDDDEIRLTCQASRFILNPETGQEILTDTQTRALRQTKYQLVNVWRDKEGGGREQVYENGKPVKAREDDPKWYEKAYAKVARNAALPLLRQDVKSQILATFRQTEKYKTIAAGRPYNPNQITAPAENERNPRPTRRQQEQRAAPPARTDTTQTGTKAPPAPSSEATATTGEDGARKITVVLRDIYDSQGTDRYNEIYRDLMQRWPAAVADGRLRRLSSLSVEDGNAALERVRAYQAGIDPDAAPQPDEQGPPEPDDEAPAPSDEE